MSIMERGLRTAAATRRPGAGSDRPNRVRAIRSASVSSLFTDNSPLPEGTVPDRRNLVRGRHYAKHGAQIDALRERGSLREALDLALECVEAAERDAESGSAAGGRAKPPVARVVWQAAQVLRALGDSPEEVRLIERWLAKADTDNMDHCASQMMWRLATAREMQKMKEWNH